MQYVEAFESHPRYARAADTGITSTETRPSQPGTEKLGLLPGREKDYHICRTDAFRCTNPTTGMLLHERNRFDDTIHLRDPEKKKKYGQVKYSYPTRRFF